MDQRRFQGEVPGGEVGAQRRGVDTGETGHLAVLVGRLKPPRQHRLEQRGALDHVAFGHRAADLQVAERPQRVEFGQAQAGLFPGLPLQRLRHRLVGRHQAADQGVPQARVGGLVEGALLHPEASVGMAADQVHRVRRDAQRAHGGPLDGAERPALGVDHRQQFVAPAARQALVAQPIGQFGERRVVVRADLPGVRRRLQRQPGLDHAPADRRLDRADLGAAQPQRFTRRPRRLRGAPAQVGQPVRIVHSPPPASSARRPPSSSTATPSSRALSSLLPASSPAIT